MLDEDEIEDTFVLERTTPDPSADGTFPADPVSFTSPPPDLEEQLKSFLKAVKKIQPDSVEDKRKRDGVMQSALVKCLGILEGAYATSLEKDGALLGRAQGRNWMAIVVRMGEKRLILEAKEVLGLEGEEGRAKRAKVDG